jgi:hypothetical protein
MVFALLHPTEYDQPRPIDGVYAATVFARHAEFHYLGRKVIASAHSPTNAEGHAGKVVVKGFSADISLNAPLPEKPDESLLEKALNYVPYVEREASFDSALIATLVPLDFDKAHPFSDGQQAFKCRTKSIDLSFGGADRFRATLDGYIQFAVTDAPCTIYPVEGSPMKCLVVLDDATLYLAKRYGRGAYDKLVADAVNEIQHALFQTEEP